MSWLAFSSLVARSETLLYVKFQPALEVMWLGINPAGARFLKMVAVYVNINKYRGVRRMINANEKISYVEIFYI